MAALLEAVQGTEQSSQLLTAINEEIHEIGKPGGKNDASLPQKKMERTEAMKASFSFTARIIFFFYFLSSISIRKEKEIDGK